MIDATLYVAEKNNKGFFNIPPEKRKNNEFFQKKEEKTITDQILSKVFPGMNISKNHNKDNS